MVGAYSQTLYVGVTNPSNAIVVNVGCTSPQALGTPLPATGMPSAGLDVFASYPPTFPIFGRSTTGADMSPATMGECNIHNGARDCNSNPNVPTGSTIDIVPRNFEFCIDGRPYATGATGQGRLAECDPAWVAGTNPTPAAIPIYLVRDACVGYSEQTTVDGTERLYTNILIRLTNEGGCGRQNQPGDLLIVLTHLVLDSSTITLPNLSVSFPMPLTSGTRLGFMCLSTESYVPKCSMRLRLTPTHLAFQLQTIASNGQIVQSPNGVRGYIAHIGCLYDNWASTNSLGVANQSIAAQVQLSPVHACP
jgi:hypothetical protein